MIDTLYDDLPYVLLAVGTCLCALLIHITIRKIENRRRRRINDVDNFNALETSPEIGETNEHYRKEARKSVAKRFSIIRRTLVFMLLFFGISISILPFINTASASIISVIAGITSVIIGIASRPFLENFISGIVLSISDRLHIGDTIYIDGELGTIEDITLTHTTVKIWNWQRYILPNSQMLNKAIRNCSHDEKMLWTHIEFTASYEQTLDELEKDLKAIVKASPYCAETDATELWPMGLDASGVKYWLAAWADGPDAAWSLRNDMRRGVISSFQRRGVASHLYHIQHHEPKQHTENDLDTLSANT